MLDVPVGVHIIAEVLLRGLLLFVHARAFGALSFCKGYRNSREECQNA